MNYYPFHLGDYAAHTAHLEPMEDLAYRRMLDLYYRTERPLPEPSEIARLIRMRDHAATIRDVLNEFFEASEDGYRHARCDAEIAKMQDKQAKARASAQASVNARSANAERTLNERSTDAELPTPTPTPTPTPKAKEEVSVAKATSQQPSGPSGPRVVRSSLFDEFWAAYPKKVGKDDARRAFEKRKPTAELAAQMVAAVNEQKQSPQWKKDGGQFIPNPATWLNQGRWQDEAQAVMPFAPQFPSLAKGAAIEAHNNEVARRILERMEREQQEKQP